MCFSGNESNQTMASTSRPAAVNPVPDVHINAPPVNDVKRPPDYNDALQFRRTEVDGYPEPSLVDQPPSYDAIY